jgi:hypothetical protein
MNIKLFTLISFLLPALVLADGKITNADIYSAAAISFTKMAASTANNVCTFNGSGFIAGGIALIGILIYQMVIPKESDFNMVFGAKE